MVDIFLDPTTDDIELVNSSMRLTQTQQELSRQKVQTNLATFKGEVFWDIVAGIAYLANDNNPEQLLGKSDKRFLDNAIKDGILSRDGIVQLVSYTSTFDKNTREVTISFEAETLEGTIVAIDNIKVTI